MQDNLSHQNVLDAFDKMEEIIWPQLSQLLSYLEASSIEKRDLAEIIKDLVKLNLIERLPGLPMKWKITESGKMKVKEYRRLLPA
jgi:hypothetical protein